MSSPKTLCDWSKSDLAKRSEELAELVRDAGYYCAKCARVANDKRVLCKSKKLPQPAKVK
ncbi:hypothetical protein NG895_28620 [Aeoliella sp. ICT_H6.2]|uniref:Uncharacterized protein n=1 Tax=Aeoliella straminimaris TaxID=2954799 RepID=A0A9X2FGF8_9BACT|nr:hypothetical protein [Aeoliella straminimaris]MCO6047888.1 hypothetical protein [Aeoliella straminimaris]